MTDFQSEQLGYDRSGDRTRDPKHRSTLAIPLRHCSFCVLSYITSFFLRIILLKLFQTVTLIGSLHSAKQGRSTCSHQTCLFTNNFTWKNQVTVDWKNCQKKEEPNYGSQIVSVWKNSINLLLEQLIEIYNSLICLRHIAHNNFCYTVNKRSGKYYY